MPETSDTPEAPPLEGASPSKPSTPAPPQSRMRRLATLAGQLALFGAIALLLQAGLGWWRAPSLPERAPAFALPNLDGDTVALSDFAGRTVVLNFWATWCPPCRVEIPSFRRFAANNPDIVVLGVAVDGEAEALREAQRKLGINYPVIRADAATITAYRVRSLPTTVVVRGDGTVRSAYAGMLFGPHLWWMTR